MAERAREIGCNVEAGGLGNFRDRPVVGRVSKIRICLQQSMFANVIEDAPARFEQLVEPRPRDAQRTAHHVRRQAI